MTIGFDFWMKRGPRVGSLWRSLRAGERMLRGRAYDGEMFLRSRRTLTSGMEFTTRVIGFAVDDDKWTIRVSGHLGDRRVRSLEATLPGHNCPKPYFCEFDMLATHNWLASKAEWSLPELTSDADDSRIEEILNQNSQMIDSVWGAFGGYGADGFQKLSLGVIRHSNHTRAFTPTVAKVCAALVYGDKECARWVLREYEESRILFVPHGIDSYTRGPSGEIRPDIVKLLEMLE